LRETESGVGLFRRKGAEAASNKTAFSRFSQRLKLIWVSFAPDARWIVTASLNQTAAIWDCRIHIANPDEFLGWAEHEKSDDWSNQYWAPSRTKGSFCRLFGPSAVTIALITLPAIWVRAQFESMA
jgi:hypothetical protein